MIDWCLMPTLAVFQPWCFYLFEVICINGMCIILEMLLKQYRCLNDK